MMSLSVSRLALLAAPQFVAAETPGIKFTDCDFAEGSKPYGNGKGVKHFDHPDYCVPKACSDVPTFASSKECSTSNGFACADDSSFEIVSPVEDGEKGKCPDGQACKGGKCEAKGHHGASARVASATPLISLFAFVFA